MTTTNRLETRCELPQRSRSSTDAGAPRARPDQAAALPPVFVLTSVRSGSTLLRAMLDRHSQLFAPPELNLWPFANLKEARLQLCHTQLEHGLVETLARVLGSEEAALARSERFRREDTPIPEIMRWIRGRIGARMLVDKSPAYLGDRRVLERIEAEAGSPAAPPRYIFLVRHPLDVLASIEKNGFDRLMRILRANGLRQRRSRPELGSLWIEPYAETEDNRCRTPGEIAEAIYHRVNTTALEFARRIPPDRFLALRYEDLVQSPMGAMERVCAFLGIAFEPAMLEPYAVSARCRGETVQDPNFLRHSAIDRTLALGFQRDEARLRDLTLTESTRLLSRALGYELPPCRTRAPLSPSQARFIAKHPSLPGLYVVVDRELELAEGSLDLPRLLAAVRSVAEETPALRASFGKYGDRWVQYQDASWSPEALRYEDLRRIDGVEAQIRSISESVEREKATLSPERAPLFRVLVFRTRERTYQIVYLFHHLIADGAAIAAFERQLWCRYRGREEAAPSRPARVRDAASELRRLGESGRERVLRDYQALLGGPPSLAALVEAHAPEGVERVRTLRRIESLGGIGVRRSPSFEAAALALHRAAGDLSGESSPLVAHRLSRRSVLQAAGHEQWCGWAAGDAPIRLDLRDELAVQRKQLRESIRRASVDSLAYDSLALEGALPELAHVTSLRLNYFLMPRHDSDEQLRFSPPEIALAWDAAIGPDYPIDFLVRDFPGYLELIVRYAHPRVRLTQVERLVARFCTHLSELSACSVSAAPSKLRSPAGAIAS